MTDTANARGRQGHVLKTMGITALAYLVNYGITLVLTPYITKTVGTEAYGFVTMAKQFVQYAAIVTTALNTFAARYIGLAWHNREPDKANTYFASVFWGNIALGGGILLLSGLLIPLMDRAILMPPALAGDIKTLFLVTFLGFFITTAFSVFGCAAYVCDRTDLTGLFKTVSYLVNAGVLLLTYALFPAKVLYVGIGTAAAAAVVGLSDLFISRRYLKGLSVSRAHFSLKAVKRLMLDGLWQSLNMVGDLLNNGLDLLVCNQMLTSLAMGQLAIAKTIHAIIHGFYTVVEQAFIPRFLRRYAEGDLKKLVNEFKIAMKASGLLANVIFAGFAALGLSYYRLWIPGEDIDTIYRLTLVTISVCIPSGAVHPLYYIYTLTVKKKVPCFVTVAGGVCNVIGMYVLIRFFGMGVYAVAWTTVAVMCVINFITNPLYMAHVLGVPKATFYPDILRNTVSCGVLTAVFCLLKSLYAPDGWLGLIGCAAAYALIGAPLHLLIACNREQRAALMGIVKRFRRKDP